MQNPNYQLFMTSVEDELLCAAADNTFARELGINLGLEPLFKMHPHSLSEGQKRKVGVAAILATCPDILILDEPTVGQDHESMNLMISAIETLYAQTNMAIITVTHDKRCENRLGNQVLQLSPNE